MITFAVEPWAEIKTEILPCWKEHHTDVADKDDAARVPLDPDWAKYQAAADRGGLQILAGRDRGELVAYVFTFIDTHLHYRSTLCAYLDLYWIRADKRGHWNGVRKMFGGTKLWLDASAVFRRCGWKETERLHTLWIGN